MRKLVSLLLCAAALLSGCARGGESQQGTAYSLYFLEADLESVPGGDALRAETVYLEEDLGTTALAEALVERLLEGPSDATLENPIPAGTSLLSLELNGAYAKVDLSSNYRSLSGVALTLADYAITLTLTQLPQIAIVSITVRGQDLAYRDTQTFTARDVLLSSNEDVIGTVPATLYFLDEEGRLTPEEFEIMKTHTTQGGFLLEKIPQLRENGVYHYAYDIARHHHERWDGRGYPDGLKGDEISLGAQIVSLADVYDALSCKRVYKDAFPRERVLQMIRDGECGVFNPELLDRFFSVEEELQRMYQRDKL